MITKDYLMIKNYSKVKKKIDDLYLNDNFFVKLKRNKINSSNYWENIVDPDGRVRKRITKNEKENFKKNINFEINYIKKLKPKRILDIGCGPGWFLSFLPKQIEKYGLEPNKYAADEASSYCNVINDDLNNINKYSLKKFDVIILHHVIEHISNPNHSIKIIKRILKKNGTLLISTPDFDSACARHFGKKYRLYNDQTHVSLFTNDSMHRFLRYHKFKIIYVHYPFFETKYFNKKNLSRMFNTEIVSPPFYGNFMSFFAINN